MQLTKHTDFAFRTLIYLASMQEELTTIETITKKFAISRSHVMKVVNKLAHAGWVKAVRGKNGGIKLGCDAKDISVPAVIKLMETTLEPVNCSQPPCLIAPACLLRGVLGEAQQVYFAHLANYTLADLLHPKTQALLNTQ